LKTILIVDDEPGILDCYRMFLEKTFPESDYSIVTIDNLTEAMEYGLAHLSEIKVTVLDGQLANGKGGCDLAYQIAVAMHQAGYQGKFIMASGKSIEIVIPDQSAQKLFSAFLTKPLGLHEFVEQITQAMQD
jgi:DNA-binding NtrC family response regulator